jgi:hypothetical protein
MKVQRQMQIVPRVAGSAGDIKKNHPQQGL